MNKPMKKAIDKLIVSGAFSKENTKTDSRMVEKGDVFFAIKGTVNDGHDHIEEALAKGAGCVVCEREQAAPDERIITVEDSREALGCVAKSLFKDPSGALKVYGVTGTNGKTTTVFLIDSILKAAGKSCGYISTVFRNTRGDSVEKSFMTTPDVMSVNRFFAEMVADGKTSAALEVSSHALDQKRISGIALDRAVFTNITPEHLDYHKNMSRYLADKAKIFSYLKPDGFAVLNADDQMVSSLTGSLRAKFVTFGLKGKRDFKAKNIDLFSGSTEFDLIAGDLGPVHICTRLIGEHNVYNILAAVAAISASGVTVEDIANTLHNAKPPPGRLDMPESQSPFKVFVDYAHTPNALENVLRYLRPLAEGRLICVFGCGGDRDKTKRPVMGKIASEFCDFVVLTNDNPRSEKPADILAEIEKGVLNQVNYCIIPDRREAIQTSLKEAKEGDIVVIAGKGHEDYQILGEKRLHFDDKLEVESILKEMGY